MKAKPLLCFDLIERRKAALFTIRYLAFGIVGAEKLSCDEEISEIDSVRILK